MFYGRRNDHKDHYDGLTFLFNDFFQNTDRGISLSSNNE